MATFTAGTSFTDGVTGDVTAAKLNALVANATPLHNLITDRTAETSVASDDLVLISDTSDSAALNKMTVANLMKAELTGTINTTAGTIATLNSTTGTIPTLASTTLLTTGTGTAASPAIVPTGDTNTGIFFPAADTIAFAEGGAEAMRIDSSGNCGIGTTSPSAKLHVVKSVSQTDIDNADQAIQIINSASDTSGNLTGIRFRQDNVTNAAQGYIGLSSTGNSSTRSNLIIASPNTSGNSTERLRIDSSGNVLVGTTSTSSLAGSGRGLLEINGSTDSALAMKSGGSLIGYLYNSSTEFRLATISANPLTLFTNDTERLRITSDGYMLLAKNTTALGTVGYRFDPNGESFASLSASANTTVTNAIYSTGASAYRFYVGMAGTVFATNTTISAISDARLKENIRDMDSGLQSILALKPRLFDWKEGKGADKKNVRGFIAQEIEQVFPDLVDEWKDPAPEGEEPYKSVRQDLIPVLVKAIQELKAENDSIKSRIEALEAA
jgi:hypothetical protein